MKPEAFEAAVSRLLDGEISPEDFAELEEYLATSGEARELYLDFVDLHNVLDLEHSLPPVIQPGSSEVVPVDRILERQKRRSFRQSAFAAAALFVLLGVVLKIVLVPEPKSLLSFRASPDTVLSVSHFSLDPDGEEPAPGTLAKGSRLQLTQGTVELTLATGVVSIVQAPADLTLHDERWLYLQRGTAWFHVPEKAIGFKVSTRNVEVTDLGTEFGVISSPDVLDEVHLLKGKVEVRNRNGLENSELLSGSTARIVGAAGRLKSTPVRPEEFLTTLPSSLPHVHLAFDAIKGDVLTVDGTHRDVSGIQARLVRGNLPADAPSLVPGKQGQALQLSGKGEFVLTDWPGISGKRTRTVACWVRMPERDGDDPAVAIVGWGSLRNEGKWKIHAVPDAAAGGRVARISLGATWYSSTKTRIDDGRWHHLAAVSYGGTRKNGFPDLAIFVDGERQTLTPHRGGRPPGASREVNTVTDTPDAVPLLVGKAVPSQAQSFRGTIDELTIYDGALSDESIRRLASE